MSNQLHRRLAFRTGGGATPDVSTDSFWETTDLSTARIYSHLEVYKRFKRRIGSGTSADPYKMTDDFETNPLWGVGSALFVSGGTDPLVVFGFATTPSYHGRLSSGNLFRRFNFVGQGDSWARTKIHDTVSPTSGGFIYTSNDDPTTIASLLTPCVTRDVSGQHWYFMQISNDTQVTSRYENTGFVPMNSIGETSPNRTTANVTTNYGIRILHVENTSGNMYPRESTINSMLTAFAAPGEYTYGSSGTAKSYVSYGMKSPYGNRDLWDFTLTALKNHDMSPSGYFTNDVPICMQVVDGGSKMFFLSITVTNGQALSCRSMTSAYDITTLSTTNTTRALTDFQAEVCAAIGASNSRIPWTWFKFHPDGKKLFLLANCGILAKFSLTNAFDLSTMSLVSAVRLPAHETFPDLHFAWGTGFPNTYSGTDSYMCRPITGADMDPEGQSLVVMTSSYRYTANSDVATPMANRFVQYRL